MFDRAINPTSLQDFKTHLHGELIAPKGEAQMHTSYGGSYERLVCIKNRYDPGNFFHTNQNIKPAREK